MFSSSPRQSMWTPVDDGPVDGEPVRLVGGDADGVGVQDLANISLVGSGHELGDAGVETVPCCILENLVEGFDRAALMCFARNGHGCTLEFDAFLDPVVGFILSSFARRPSLPLLYPSPHFILNKVCWLAT